MSYLVDSDWLVDALVGMPAAVSLLAQLCSEGLAVSIISYGEIMEGMIGSPDPQAERERALILLAPSPLAPLSAPTTQHSH